MNQNEEEKKKEKDAIAPTSDYNRLHLSTSGHVAIDKKRKNKVRKADCALLSRYSSSLLYQIHPMKRLKLLSSDGDHSTNGSNENSNEKNHKKEKSTFDNTDYEEKKKVEKEVDSSPQPLEKLDFTPSVDKSKNECTGIKTNPSKKNSINQRTLELQSQMDNIRKQNDRILKKRQNLNQHQISLWNYYQKSLEYLSNINDQRDATLDIVLPPHF